MSSERVAILAHGKNWQIPVPSNPEEIELSIESKMTAEAAGVLFTQGIADLIIYSSGRTAGQAYPSEAKKMREITYETFTEAEIPLKATVLEEDSYDTFGNLSIVKERMPELAVDSLILLTIGYHLPRVKRLAKILEVPVKDTFKSDYVIRNRHGGLNHLYARAVVNQAIDQRSVKPLMRTAASYSLEAAGWGLSYIDPKSEHFRFVTAKVRHQNQ